jgi:hypothetical protein
MGITGAAVRRQAGEQAEGEQVLAIFDERKTESGWSSFPDADFGVSTSFAYH